MTIFSYPKPTSWYGDTVIRYKTLLADERSCGTYEDQPSDEGSFHRKSR
jgi:hypothetical protein